MKKLLLASAVAALSITAAQAAPQVYGKAYLTLDIADGDDNSAYKDSRTQLNSNASRIGLKGSEALTQNTDLIYQLEYRVDIDSNAARNWESRDTYLGLANKQYGTLVAGRLTAIDDYVNYANVTTGGVVGGDKVLASFDAPRANNAFAYFSPERNGLQFMGMYVLDEDKTDVSKTLSNAGGAAARQANDSLGRDAFGVGAKYEPANAPYKVGATYIQAGDAVKAARVSGSYAVSPALTAGALYQHTDYNTNNNENAVTLSANYKVANTPWTTYGQLDFVDNLGGVNNSEAQRIAVGGKYAFNKATTGHIYGAFLQREVAGVDADAYGIGGGIEYKF
ncbi:MAG: porin [Moraxella sp.]|nr:porin [Moraxella sp.]